MAAHLSDQLLQRYGASDLAPEELLALDQHLETCVDCRERLLAQQLSALPHEHLAYEQMAAFVQGELSVEEHRQANAHLKRCAECAWQVSELRAFAATLNPRKHYQPPVPAWKRWLTFGRTPQPAEVVQAAPQVAPRAPVAMPAPAAYVARAERLPLFRRPLWQGATALALLLLGSFIVWQWQRPTTQVAQLEASPTPPPTVTPEPRLSSTLATTPPPAQVTPTPRAAAPSVWAMMLVPLRARGGAEQPPSFQLPSTTTDVKMTLTEIVKADADGKPYQRYVAALDQQTRKLKTNMVGNGVALTLPAASLSNGRHKLTLYGVTAAGNEEAVREYPFIIAGRK
jgi:anti-sigma factor RsiW